MSTWPAKRAGASYWAALLGATAACSGHGGTNDTTGSTEPTVHDAGTDASFDADSATPAPADAREGGIPSLTLVTEPDQGMTPIYQLISSARHTVDMTMYELTDTTVVGLLTTAAKNGVMVRVILDQNLEERSNTAAYDVLAAGHVQVHWANTTYAATHQKTVTVDSTTSAIMTPNLTPDYYATSRDFVVITSVAADVAAIEATFSDDFANMSVNPPTGDNLVWSPTNAESSLLGLINGAKSTLLVENEEMSYAVVVSALASAAMRGVKVEVVMTGSRSWDASFTTLTTAGVHVSTYARNASLYIHAKVILADYGNGKGSVFIGSENFSETSLTSNRELGIITTDAAIMTSINSTLTKDFDGGTAYP